MSEELYKPGEPAPVSSQVEIVGPRGGHTGEERTVVQGKPLPPTPQAGQRYRVADPTHNGAGKPKK
jgi:hypothetical protein